MEDTSSKKRVRDDSDESGLESPEVKRLRDDLLEFLDDTDPALSIQDLDSVMKSLQEEISASSSPPPVVEMTSDSGDSQPQIGYLLEASDDELGLPPPGDSVNPDGKSELQTELVPLSSDSSGIAEFWEFENQIPSYDSFDLGTGVGYSGNTNCTEYVAFDGLFDHSDVYYPDISESWRHETLPAQ